MKIKCKSCGNVKEVNKELIGSILGGTLSSFGVWAWTSYLFAGTGMAFGICVALVAGGPALYAYRTEIIKLLMDKGYKCDKCEAKDWDPILEAHDYINTKETYFEDEVKKKEFGRKATKYSNFKNRFKKLQIKLDNQNIEDSTELIVHTGAMLNDMNEFLVKELCFIKEIDPSGTQAKKIEKLKDTLSKEITNHLYSINNLRNKIMHPSDYGIDLSSLNRLEVENILAECKMAMKNINYIFEKELSSFDI